MKKIYFGLLAVLLVFGIMACSFSNSAPKQIRINMENLQDLSASDSVSLATLGGGCFWCLEAVYQRMEGVQKVVSGYTGGKNANPTYREICNGNTGHAEVVQVHYDARKVSYAEILEVFWRIHDPTTLNRQGADVGTQYRSAIFYHNDKQKEIAEKSIEAVVEAKLWSGKITTQVAALDVFYPAESYHQNYYNENSEQGYCVAVVAPKVEKFKKLFKEKLKATYKE